MVTRALITGGSGFVGKELIHKLLASTAWQVINIDIVPSFIDGITEFQHDLSVGPIDIPPVDVCIHLASGVGGILFNYKDYLIDYNHNINYNTYVTCKVHDPIFVFVSSINVFENSKDIFGTEEPSTAYAISKLRGEQFFTNCDFEHCYIVRPPNLFGKSQLENFDSYGESHVIPDLVNKINIAEKEIEVWGDGTQIRNFVHVSDLCDFLIKIVQNLPQETFFSIRSDITITIKDLVDRLLRLSQRTSLDVKFNNHYMKYEILHIENMLEHLENIGKTSSIEEGLM